MVISNLFKSKKAILQEHRGILSSERNNLLNKNREILNKKLEGTPLFSAKNKLATTLNQLKQKRASIIEQWNASYKSLSWWGKLNYSGMLDLSELDKPICELESLYKKFNVTYSDDIETLENYFRDVLQRSEYRIEATYKILLEGLEQYQVNITKVDNDNLFSRAALLATLSIPVSVWGDLNNSSNIYDCLRKVNGNFQDMSDMEIWWESLWMSKESLSGLMSLTKGAYFEHLVAEDTGGQLFEYFNNPDVDIVIDGVAFQLKATDSVSYIATVDDEIPVISTTEVAEKTGVIDSGYSNEELTNSVDLALGGTVVDTNDTVLDAVLIGADSLAFFATIKGINHAQQKFDNGMDGVDAIFEGAGLAFEGTVKGIVDLSEMGYKVATSRPIRFVGRSVVKVLNKI